MKQIPNTTICCIDCYNYELSISALRRCMQEYSFDKAVLLTDKDYKLKNIDVIKIANIRTKEQYSIFVIKELNKYIDTDFVLLIQYDGFIANPGSWTNEFQDYDYIGAKWCWYSDGFNVGNGGFSLRSKRLLQALSEDTVPVSIESLKYGEDTFICRLYRRFLETQNGIKFASESIADRFSHERSAPEGKPFGFHGLFNMWRYLGDEELIGFVNLLNPRTLGSIEALELGFAYHKLGKFKQAGIIYNRIIEFYPDHKDALKLRRMLKPV